MNLLEIAIEQEKKLKYKFPYNIEWWLNNGMIIENYHKHTTWSNLIQIDSATDVMEFMRLNDSYGNQCMFSGEHGYQGEWLYIYDICKNTNSEGFREKNKLSKPSKFRYSTEAYWVKDRKEKDRTNCHMVIIARNYNAMRKLNYIISVANDEGFYGKPRIDLELLFQLNKDDVYITSACLAGWKYEDAEDIWLSIWNHFEDSFFLEYQTHNTVKQKDLNTKISNLANKHGIQTIIGLDTHYINDEDRIKRDNLLTRKNLKYDGEDGWYMDFPDGQTVYQRMKQQEILTDDEIIYSMMNCNIFIDECQDVSIDTGFKIPILDEYKDYSYKERVNVLKKIINESYKKEEIKTKERIEGLLYEVGEIDGSDTVDYFITNERLVSNAINKYDGHLTTTSRGSAASYYTSKLLGFTTMDRFESEVPIYPERFITKERIKSSHQMPDIDLNTEKQEPFVLSAKELLGEHGCYPLLAVGKLGEKSGFKLYADIRGIEPSIANEITKGINDYNDALNQAEDEEDKKNIEIEDFIEKQYIKTFYDSKPYQGIIEQSKVHACGFLIFNGDPNNKDIIGYGDIRYEIGLIRCHSESTGKSTLVACVEGGMLDSYGYVKDDFLIVDVVGITRKLYESIGMKVPSVRELRRMVENDEETWRMYGIGATCCLNQCEKPSTTKKVIKYQPKNIKELSAFIAGIRPGFKSRINGFLDRIKYSNGEDAIDKLLEDCFQYMLYQEAIMKIFSWLGVPMKESYDTIKKISKKKLVGKQLEHVEDTLKKHWLQNIGNLDNFEPVYKVIKDSAKYSFNAPHALAMANDSLYEAWMKAHHTSNFYEVTLNHYQDKDDKNKVADLLKEAMTIFGYQISSFKYGYDNTKFTVDDSAKIIYPNLSSVKGIGYKAVQSMMDIYYSGKNNIIDIYLSTRDTNVNKTVFRYLIKIGYFSQYGSVKKLIKIVDLVDDWKGTKWEGKKTISKKNIAELGLGGIDLAKFATDVTPKGKISDAQYRVLDWIGLVREMTNKYSDEEYGVFQLVKFQHEILGYIEYKVPDLDWRYIVVTELDTRYSPKFKAYSISNGKVIEMKVHNKKNPRDKLIQMSFNELQFKDGDILYIKNVKQEPKKQNVDGKWIPVPEIKEWWIKDYSMVQIGDSQ